MSRSIQYWERCSWHTLQTEMFMASGKLTEVHVMGYLLKWMHVCACKCEYAWPKADLNVSIASNLSSKPSPHPLKGSLRLQSFLFLFVFLSVCLWAQYLSHCPCLCQNKRWTVSIMAINVYHCLGSNREQRRLWQMEVQKPFIKGQ